MDVATVNTAKIADVFLQGGSQNKVGPCLVRFEHADVNPKEFQKLQPQLSYDNIKDKSTLRLSLRSDHLSYSNKMPSVSGVRKNPYQNIFLALRNKRTNKMQLYEMNAVTVGAEVTPPKSANLLLSQPKEADKTKHRMSMKKHLVKEFGQAKGQRIYEQADRMTVESSQLDSKVNQAAMNLSHDALILEPQENVLLQLTPPCNRNAKSVADVYDLDDILTPRERENLEESASAFKTEYKDVGAIKEGVKNRWFSELFGHIAQHQVNGDNLGQALYLEGLVQLLNMRAKELDRGPKGLPSSIPYSLREKIFATFTVNNRLTPESRDRGLCYAIILGLLANKFSFEFNALSSSVKTRADQIKRLISVVGASIQMDNLTSQNYVVLKLPLATFDANKNSARKKRKTM